MTVEYKLIRSKRKSVSIHIENGKVIVRAPRIYPVYEIEKFIHKKEKWINNHINKQLSKPQISYHNSDVISYLGEEYTLIIIEKSIQEKVELDDNNIYLYSHYKKENEAHNKKILDKWIENSCLEIFTEKYNELFKLFDYKNKPPLFLRRFKSRWGAYHKRGFKDKITLNINLIMYPIECLEYVIIHELSHKTHLNHSKNFYNLVEKKYPNWKKSKAILDGKID